MYCSGGVSNCNAVDVLTRPNAIKVIGNSDKKAELVLEPLKSGFALTLGNALRRVMLSSLIGPAVYGMKIKGVAHEFTSIQWVREDVTDIALNVGMLICKLHNISNKCLNLSVKGPCKVVAGMIDCGEECEILNKDLLICTIEKDIEFDISIYVCNGSGYFPASEYKKNEFVKLMGEQDLMGFIPVGATFSPVKCVSFKVENSRVGQVTDNDKLILCVETNGIVSAKESASIAARVLQDQLQSFVDSSADAQVGSAFLHSKNSGYDQTLLIKITDLELTVRSYNCLKSDGVVYVGDLVCKTEADMLRTANFGRKSLNEIKAVLAGLGLSFGMDVPNWPPKDIEELLESDGDDVVGDRI